MPSSEPARLLADRYRLHAVIGHGGMGTVWRARDELLNRDVAVKEIVWPPQMDAAERETARQRAVREAQLAARLHHPNVVGVYDIVEEDDRPCIVMELVPFRSLRDAIVADGPMAPSQAARIGLGVLAALHAVHQAGVVHRDVKPANILLGPDGRVVLADFGIAKAVDSPLLTKSGVLMGSPSYLAPERAHGERADAAADLWALGASLYAAVEGQPPFDRGDVLASMTAVVAEEPDPPVHAGPLRPVIDGLLRKDPATRLSLTEAARMLHHALAEDNPARTADETVPPPQPPPPHEPPGPPGRSRGRRKRLAALAAIVVVALITTGFALASAHPPGHQATPAPSHQPSKTPSPSSPAGTTPPQSSPPSQTPSSQTPSSPAGTSAALPAGYYRFTNPTGFSIGVPQGWQITHVGHYVYVRDPVNSAIFLLIDQSDHPKANPLADWQQQAANRQDSYPGYHLILLRAVRYTQAEKAADWEFTYDRNGVTVEVLNRNILANPQHAYALYWSTPASDWNAYYHYFQAFAATFRPAGPS